jgi:putative PEP-CTERM system TPR-repeat lipoprotein
MSLLRVLCVLVLLLTGCGRFHSETDLLAEAARYVARGEAKSAVIQLKNALQKNPDNGQARLMLGRLYLDMGEVQSAEKELRRALALKAPPGDVSPPLGLALLQQGQYQQLLDEMAADPQQPQLLALRGHALLGLNRADQAKTVFAQILASHPDHPAGLLGQARVAMLGGAPQQAGTLVQKALTREPDNIDALRLQGDVLRMQDRNKEALAPYRHILKLHPVQVQAHVDLASLYIQLAQPDNARKELGLARQVTPNSLLLIYTQALLDFQQNKLTAAQDQLAMVLRAAPEHMPSNLLMGAILRNKGASTQAEQHLRKYLAAYPGHPYASKLLASVLLSGGAPQQALAVVEPLFDSQQQDVEMMTLAGEIYMRLQQYGKSAAYFESASKLSPQASLLHAALAMSHLGLGDNARAVQEMESAARLDQKSTRVGSMLVLSHLRGKDYPKALAAVQRMEAQQPDNPMLQNLKGGVLLMNHDNTAARLSFERALVLAPGYLPALDNLTSLDLKQQQPAHARRRLEAALAKAPQNIDLMTALAKLAVTQQQPGAARTWLERAAQAQPDAPDPAMRLANFYASNNELAKALQLAQQLQTTYPAQPQLMAMLAALQSRSGQGAAATDSWSKLASLQPDSADVQLRLAEARSTARDTGAALQAVHQALRLRADFPQAQGMLVRLLLEQGAHAKALQAARGYQQLRADLPLGYKLEADVLSAQQQFQPALAMYQKAYDLQPSSLSLITLHRGLLRAGKTTAADSRIRRWLDKHSNDQAVRLYYADTQMVQKDYTAAIASFELVLKQSPQQILALNNLAWLCQQQKDPRALVYAEQAYKLAPDSAAVIDTLGWILVGQGKLQRALPLLKQAAALAPENAGIRAHYAAALGQPAARLAP